MKIIPGTVTDPRFTPLLIPRPIIDVDSGDESDRPFREQKAFRELKAALIFHGLGEATAHRIAWALLNVPFEP